MKLSYSVTFNIETDKILDIEHIEEVVEEQLKESLFANGWSGDEFKVKLLDYNV